MSANTISIDGKPVEIEAGQTVLAAARKIGTAIPTLCHLEKCGPLNTCQVCLVKLVSNGQSRLAPACGTIATPGMVVESETVEVHEARRTALELLFSDHVGDCLSPCQRLCPLLLNVPVMIRHIESGRMSEAVAAVYDTLPLPSVLGRLCHHPCEQGCRRGGWDSPAMIRNMEQFAAAENNSSNIPYVPARAHSTGKNVAIVGSGPAGLAAAYYLVRHGNNVTVIDRRSEAGGKLRDVPEAGLPPAELEADIAGLRRMGVEFRQNLELGNQITLPGLLLGFQAVVLAFGGLENADGSKPGVALSGGFVKTDPNTCLTSLPGVFACGGAVKSVGQLVRAMSEGKAAAECVNQFLHDRRVRRPEKPFSSIMGRIDPGELRRMLRTERTANAVTPCDRCRGYNRAEAVEESARCLHCDCRSSGDCALQHYAQIYGADANRFKGKRREFEQEQKPGGIIFEPGKCILCGICVKLTEMAGEELGLTFVGRGFDVRVSAPFDLEVNEGLQKVAAECVMHCPTGALAHASPAFNHISHFPELKSPGENGAD